MMTVLSAQTVILAVIVVSANPGWCQSNQMAFKMTKFPGNTTVQSLAFQPTAFLTVLPNVSIVACGSSCIAFGTCNSFNWVEGSPASFGRCEIINGSTWTPSFFVSRTTESSKFFVNEVLSKTDGYYVIIPAINQDPVNLDNPSIPWKTDCNAQNGTMGGFIVGMRNNRTESAFIDHFKCRVFKNGFSMTSEPPNLVNYASYPNVNMTCLPGWVMTGTVENANGYPLLNTMRCHRPAAPWFVNMAACRTIRLLTMASSPTPSPMYDPRFTGNPDTQWGAQCGNSTHLEAATAMQWNYNYRLFETMICCRIQYT